VVTQEPREILVHLVYREILVHLDLKVILVHLGNQAHLEQYLLI
jgi:hypothetical protein